MTSDELINFIEEGTKGEKDLSKPPRNLHTNIYLTPRPLINKIKATQSSIVFMWRVITILFRRDSPHANQKILWAA
ncbi:hypothetical protein PUN28_012551 [Cardiocondyla obscurior]|uniref:Uncharacterized protein n=1 Tax=Cardiocondyla obscurior TaxID=286306 RepID=A0AAW2FFD5_9HYME